MRASWCWQDAETTLSDVENTSLAWRPDQLLNTVTQAPRFARNSWDVVKARAFGAWTISAPTPPPPEPQDTTAAETEVIQADAPALPTPAPVADPTASQETAISEAALAQLREQAFQEGLTAGRAQLEAEISAERLRERELIRNLGLELRSISQDPQRFFEPLKRLSLHLAEQLVRAELQLSGQAIHGLVQSCIRQLDHPVPPIQVSLNAEDLQRLQAMGESVTADLQLEADPNLRPGSVRVRVQDSVVQDLIDNRLEPLARQLLPEPEAWTKNSSLVQDRAEPLPESTPKREWNRPVMDVEDTDVKPARQDENNNEDGPA